MATVVVKIPDKEKPASMVRKDEVTMAEKIIGTDVNQIEILSLSKIRGQQKVTNLLDVNLSAFFQSRQTGNTGTFGPALLCGPMYGCGLRFGEAVHLCWDKNIDFINSTIHIQSRTSKNGFPPFSIKNHQDRSIPAPKWVMERLEELKQLSNKKNPYVFITDDRLKYIKKKWAECKDAGETYKWQNGNMVNNTNRNFVVNCNRAGIVTSDKLSVHCFRKSYGTNLADLGTPVHTLKSLMGHSNIATTMAFYIKNSDENSMKAVRGLERLMG